MKYANVLFRTNERTVHLLTLRWTPFHIRLKCVLIFIQLAGFFWAFLFLMTLSANHCETIGTAAEPRAVV